MILLSAISLEIFTLIMFVCLLIAISLTFVLIRFLYREKEVPCIKCGYFTPKGSFRLIQIMVSISLFPIGLLSLIAGRKPTVCERCGHMWIA